MLHTTTKLKPFRKRAIIKVLNDDSETEGYEESRTSPRTPRKVRFGGESVKLRTPESDSSHQAEEEENDSSILTITVTDANCTTKKSLIPGKRRVFKLLRN